jgi:GGDEF domain-containing protein
MFKIIKQYRELKWLAYHDSLTGLLNRNWLYKNIDKINAKYVYFIDINDLHKINKNGHTLGDEYIKKAIATIKHNGTLVRYAGDEFMLFSDFEDEVATNDYFSVGVSIILNSIEDAIKEADSKMIANKKQLKLIRGKNDIQDTPKL